MGRARRVALLSSAILIASGAYACGSFGGSPPAPTPDGGGVPDAAPVDGGSEASSPFCPRDGTLLCEDFDRQAGLPNGWFPRTILGAPEVVPNSDARSRPATLFVTTKPGPEAFVAIERVVTPSTTQTLELEAEVRFDAFGAGPTKANVLWLDRLEDPAGTSYYQHGVHIDEKRGLNAYAYDSVSGAVNDGPTSDAITSGVFHRLRIVSTEAQGVFQIQVAVDGKIVSSGEVSRAKDRVTQQVKTIAGVYAKDMTAGCVVYYDNVTLTSR